MPEALIRTQTVFQNIHVPSIPDVNSEDDFNLDEIEDEPKSPPDLSISGKDGTENAASVTIMAGHDYFSADWIQREALSLLNRIRQQCDTSVQGKRIVLAGYGSGGIVIKQVRRVSSCLELRRFAYIRPGHHYRQQNANVLSCCAEHRQACVFCYTA